MYYSVFGVSNFSDNFIEIFVFSSLQFLCYSIFFGKYTFVVDIHEVGNFTRAQNSSSL
jgi:hypothetical protein